MDGLIGYTGFVGSNLSHLYHFDKLFNSENIKELGQYSFNILVVAAPTGSKLMANQNPDKDYKSVCDIISELKMTQAELVIHLSTIDVYNHPNKVDEYSIINTTSLHPYGKNRLFLENFIRKNFKNHLIVRLPSLYGEGLKKNFIYDLLNNKYLTFTHKSSCFQLYCLNYLWSDIQFALKEKIPLVNLVTEPINAADISLIAFGKEFTNIAERPPIIYNVRTIYANRYKKIASDYFYSRDEVLKQLKEFLIIYKKSL